MHNIIKNFNSDPSYDNYSLIINTFFPTAHLCKICGGYVFYNNSKIRIKKSGEIEIIGKSHLSKKKHGESLVVCEKCLKNKFPYYESTKNYFNTLNEITIFAFNITNKDPYKTGVTLSKLIDKYGEEEGEKRWANYINKQAYSNSYEYKNKKYSWSKEEYVLYNRERSTTLNNMIKRHGEIEGKKRWDSYIQRQQLTKSYEYMVDTYGIERVDAINKSKAQTLENYIERYGEIGYEKYIEYVNKKHQFYSKISQKLFFEIDEILEPFGYTTYFAEKEGEYGKYTTEGYKLLDYYILEKNLCIEFYGDVFHANPSIYNSDDTPNPFNTELKSKDIWENDFKRIEALKSEHNIETIVIWESDYKQNEFNLQNFLKKWNII